MKNIKYILSLLAATLLMTACTDNLIDGEGGTGVPSADKGIGQMVLFSSGTTVSSVATRADDDGDKNNGITETPGKTYYMADGGRFVCRMYYKASSIVGDTQDDPYDVSGNTDVTTWMKVDGHVGNSLYWRNTYPATVQSTDTYGNDADAICFYWQNRKEHAFLAWTNYNRLTTIGYSPDKNSGELKFEPADETYQKHTGLTQEQWVQNGYQVHGTDQEFRDWAELRTFMETGTNYETIRGQVPAEADFSDQHYYYAYGWSCKFRMEKGYSYVNVDDAHRKSGWIEYQMFYDKLPYKGDKSGGNIEVRRNNKNVPIFLFDNASKKYLAQIEIKFYSLDDQGNITIDDQGNITTNPYTPEATDINMKKDGSGTEVLDMSTVADGDKIRKADGTQAVAQCVFVYYLTDDYGNEKYNEKNPRFTFYYKNLEQKKNQEIVEEYQANVFDLTRKPVLDAQGNPEKDAQGNIKYGINKMSEQPDILQALTKQAPLGATQEANRVNLYFKHQFSQVQVNVKGSADMSVVLKKDNIRKVELLGVTEKGYVFTELKANGTVEPTNYEHVDISKYSDEHLAKNQYGTAFEMFDMATGKDAEGKDVGTTGAGEDAGYPAGYLKSFNALTFGQLQAIRVTWQETESDTMHESTFTVANEKLKNLESGKKYVWSLELRRGTLAIIRTEIVDWIVPESDLEYDTSGTISN